MRTDHARGARSAGAIIGTRFVRCREDGGSDSADIGERGRASRNMRNGRRTERMRNAARSCIIVEKGAGRVREGPGPFGEAASVGVGVDLHDVRQPERKVAVL